MLAEPASAAAVDDVLGALEEWQLAADLRRSLYVYPVVNTLHILALATLVASIVIVDLRMLGAFRGTPFAFFGRILEPAALIGLVFAIVTGFFLFVVKPFDYVENPAFLVKIGLVALGVVNALTQRFGANWRPAMDGNAIAGRMRAQAALSLVIWLGAVFAGRFIAYLE